MQIGLNPSQWTKIRSLRNYLDKQSQLTRDSEERFELNSYIVLIDELVPPTIPRDLHATQ